MGGRCTTKQTITTTKFVVYGLCALTSVFLTIYVLRFFIGKKENKKDPKVYHNFEKVEIN